MSRMRQTSRRALETGIKRCTRYREEKRLIEFSWRSGKLTGDGRLAMCKACYAEKDRERRLRIKDTPEYRAARREHFKKYSDARKAYPSYIRASRPGDLDPARARLNRRVPPIHPKGATS